MFRILAAAAALALVAVPASAAVVVNTTDVNLANGPLTFGPVAGDQFRFSYKSGGGFDPSPVFIMTTGTAEVTAVFGMPSVDFPDGRGGDVVFGPRSFPGFASVPKATAALDDATPSLIGLSYSVGKNIFYGYALFDGANFEE